MPTSGARLSHTRLVSQAWNYEGETNLTVKVVNLSTYLGYPRVELTLCKISQSKISRS